MANRDNILFNYDDMEAIVKRLNDYKTQYEEAATTLKSSMDEAINDWTGASKEKFSKLFNDSVYGYLHDKVPNMVQGLSDLLKNNAEGMASTDEEIAKRIPDKI